ncbi:hypothetical protein [Mycolicibacterium brisbanense]|uniref:Uncharacterized protein n=1 Tax=Mycolicibacterium brisbanense TaxID=146020 RepID=A0A100VZK4_9MYCO|nr:hypothetical protein [Mycolicibacterium brisbanense]MCV7156142.1 hypothetical protein [Mycolicibacterium brisbanense]GAS88899.1 uncharacterized protein RMCB_2995 [Mycolicibacterium brisbanense]
MAAPTPVDLANLLGVDGVGDGVGEISAEQATEILGIITAIVKSATRGNGFQGGVPTEDLRAVILTSAARLWRHPSQVDYGETKGPESVFYRSGWDGFTVGERYVINRYRRTAM